MRSWPIVLPLVILAAACTIAMGQWRESERLSGIAAERLQVAESYAEAEELSRARARCYSGLADLADEEDASFRSGKWANVGTWEAQERAQAARYERDAAHWGMLKEKYRRAAATPWDPVEFDPPPPVD